MRKQLAVLLIPLLLLAGCQGEAGVLPGAGELTAEEEARQVRGSFLAAGSCSGTAEVTADYGLRVYEFTLDFTWQREGDTVLTLTAPEELAGLTAKVSQGQTRLEFDGISLDTGAITGEGLTPMELVPALMEWAQTGFMDQCVYETLDDTPVLRVQFRDPDVQPGSGTECAAWFSRADHALLRAELYWNGELALSGNFLNFTLGDDGDGIEQSPDLGGSEPGESGA